jgi:amidase
MGSMGDSNWRQLSQICRDILEGSIPKQWLLPTSALPTSQCVVYDAITAAVECGILTSAEVDMTESDAVDIRNKYQQGEWTARAVTTAFLKRATVGHQLVRDSALFPSVATHRL